MKKIVSMSKFLCCAMMFLTTSCLTHQYLKKDFKQNSKIAVICAEPKYKELSMSLVSKLESELIKSTTFTVVKQDQIMKVIPDYPQKIKGPYGMVVSSNIDENYSKTDISSLKEIAKKLKVDYLYVVWTPLFVEYVDAGTMYLTPSIAQLFEFPSGEEMAHIKFEPVWKEKGLAINIDKTPEKAFEKWSEYLVKDIGKNTKTLK